MTRTCATPGCSTLTFGEICLGCVQRALQASQDEAEREEEPRAAEDSRATAAA